MMGTKIEIWMPFKKEKNVQKSDGNRAGNHLYCKNVNIGYKMCQTKRAVPGLSEKYEDGAFERKQVLKHFTSEVGH